MVTSITPELLHTLTDCPTTDIAASWPYVVAALQEFHCYTRETVIAAIATLTVECRFKPVAEAWWLGEAARNAYYDTTAYGKVNPTTGQRYFGRGLIQLTWDYNYATYGKALGVDLTNHPEIALEYHTSARVLAKFFVDHGTVTAAHAGDWQQVRRSVNGGLNGWEVFDKVVLAAAKAIEAV